MSLEDETITQKTRVFRIELEKQKPREKKIIDEFGEYNDELTQKLNQYQLERIEPK